MRAGKLPLEALQARVLRYLGRPRPEVLVHAAPGQDAAAVAVGDWALVVSSDPITGAARDLGWFAVHVACNDVAAAGAEPLGVLLTLLLPEGSSLSQVEEIMTQADRAARELGVEVLGGHTEFTLGLDRPLVSTTALGLVPRGRLLGSGGARPGHELILTKAAGLEGTAILAAERGEELVRALGPEPVERALAFAREISVVREALAAARSGASAMHDATEGGVLGAAFELAEASGVGLELRRELVPVRSETEAICRCLGLDPLRLIASGSLLVAAPPGSGVVEALSREGVAAAVVGRLTESGAGRWLVEGGERRPLLAPEGDELWRAKEEEVGLPPGASGRA
ncbi:MAG: AIR synthase family protein [Acetobacteraceae bacterium]|nr:AIR synthase family protein [Acetobacteraceae bacterium]